MNLIYFTKDAYKLLKKDLNANRNNYYSEDPWLDEYFATAGLDEFYRTSSIAVPNIDLICSGDDIETKNRDDLINIKTLYTDYKDKITPLQASDPLLWSALCHIVFKDYILKRWKKADETVSIDKRFFATEGRSSLLYYNAISREAMVKRIKKYAGEEYSYEEFKANDKESLPSVVTKSGWEWTDGTEASSRFDQMPPKFMGDKPSFKKSDF